MSLSRLMLVVGILVLGCTSCGLQEAPPSTPLPEPAAPRPLLPDWLAAKIKTYESQPLDYVPSEIWLIQQRGQPAFFFRSPCCDQYDPLLNASGQEICNPAGGITGDGDGKCPTPADPGTPVTFVWAHPATPPARHYVPQLSCISCVNPMNAPLSSLPDWLATKIKRSEPLPVPNSDFKQVWRIRLQGQPAYYAVTGRLYDELFSASGELLCKPTGGDYGQGDGKCPWPADPGTETTFIWAHPKANPRDSAVPRLSNQSLFRTERDTAELRRQSVAWMQAIEKKDEAALQALMAPEYVLMAAGDAEQTSRREWIANAIDKDWSRFRHEHLRIRLNGDGDHATVSSRLYFHVSPIPIQLDAGVVDTWERRGGRWQVTARYLGQSNAGDRIKLIVGFLAALVLVAAGFGVAKLARRMRLRSVQ